MKIFENLESNVRSYCRNYPDIFVKAKGSIMYTENGKEYIDFLSGAGALNYGHNNEFIKERIIDYVLSDGIMHGLDMYTEAKRNFIDKFYRSILEPRNMIHKIQFCGPTGTNAVEAALKLARKVTGRTGIFAFMGGFHGMTLGSLSVTGSNSKRNSSGVPLQNVTFIPYPKGCMNSFDTIEYMKNILDDDHSGIETPAAIIFESIQAEGGVHIASRDWLRRLSKFCSDYGILLICDDIQVGCGRTGTFFSFEEAEIMPDIIVLSKSISGYGLPMSILLMKPEYDIWEPAEHNGTFRGNQLAFIGAASALEYREMCKLEQQVKVKEALVKEALETMVLPLHEGLTIRGKGLIWGIDFSYFNDLQLTKKVIDKCYSNGLIIERAGRKDSIIKLMPSLSIEEDILGKGCSIIAEAIEETIL